MDSGRHTATPLSKESIKIPKYDNTLPPEYSSPPKSLIYPKSVPDPTTVLAQSMLQNPAYRGIAASTRSELTDIRMAMAAEYQATQAMKSLIQQQTSTAVQSPAVPGVRSVVSGAAHPVTVAAMVEERKRKAMQAMIQARRELEEIVVEEAAQSALQSSRQTLRERAAAAHSALPGSAHNALIRPRTVLSPQTSHIVPTARLAAKPTADMHELMINQQIILQRHFLEEKKRRLAASQTLASAMITNKLPITPSPLNGQSGELRVDANGKQFIC